VSQAKLQQRLADILRAAPGLMQVLRTAQALDLPDWLVFSGAVYQPVLNQLTGRPVEYGIKDYDLAYFDPADVSYEAEDVVIRKVAAAFEEPLRSMVEVRNQGRVHLWFEAKFGEPYAPLSSSAEALSRFVTTINAVGVRLQADDSLRIEAPFGLDDLFALRLRQNPARSEVRGFGRVAGAMRARWPELAIVEAAA
jgi:hypothetical protein